MLAIPASLAISLLIPRTISGLPSLPAHAGVTGSPHGFDGGDELMMSRRAATIIGALVAALTVVGGVAGTRVISVGPSAAPDTSAAAMATAASALGSPQAGKIRSIATGAPSSATPTSYSPQQSAAPQASYSQAAPVAATATS